MTVAGLVRGYNWRVSSLSRAKRAVMASCDMMGRSTAHWRPRFVDKRQQHHRHLPDRVLYSSNLFSAVGHDMVERAKHYRAALLSRRPLSSGTAAFSFDAQAVNHPVYFLLSLLVISVDSLSSRVQSFAPHTRHRVRVRARIALHPDAAKRQNQRIIPCLMRNRNATFFRVFSSICDALAVRAQQPHAEARARETGDATASSEAARAPRRGPGLRLCKAGRAAR